MNPKPIDGNPEATRFCSLGQTALLIMLGGMLLWSYWPVLHELGRDWWSSSEYGVGALVPIVVVYLLWTRFSEESVPRLKPCYFALLPLGAAIWLRFYGMDRGQQSIERYAFVTELISLVWLIAGTHFLRRHFWLLAFLYLMAPLPGSVHNRIAAPLQGLATDIAQISLELGGFRLERAGNILLLDDDISLAVAEACSGLRMLTAFIIVAGTLALMIKRPFWQTSLLMLSSVPIAIFANAIRLVATAYLFIWWGGPWVQKFFHDFAGYAMMPVALILMSVELSLFSRLILVEEEDKDRSSTSSPEIA